MNNGCGNAGLTDKPSVQTQSATVTVGIVPAAARRLGWVI